MTYESVEITGQPDWLSQARDDAHALGVLSTTPIPLSDDNDQVVAGVLVPPGWSLAREVRSKKNRPDFISREARVHSFDSFCAYADRFKSAESTTVWLDVPKGQVVMVIDDHTTKQPERAAHTCSWLLEASSAAQRWKSAMTPRALSSFVDLLTDGLEDITDHWEAAQLVEQLSSTAKIKVTRTRGGGSAISVDGSTEGVGHSNTELPPKLTVEFRPWVGCTATVSLSGRITWKVDGDTVTFHVEWTNRADQMISAGEQLAKDLAKYTELPVFLGIPS